MPSKLFLVLFLFAIPAHAADKWTSVQSKNFLLVGNATENQIRDVAENLELFRTAYSKFFPLEERVATVDTTVFVFKSDSSFRPYKPIYQGKPANISGYFQGGKDKNLIVLSADIPTPRVIYHEFVHRLMSDNFASMPLWFQEGFAECFSTLEVEGKDKKLRLGRAIAEHVFLLNDRRFMPLEQLFAVTPESREYNEEEKQGVFYAESWALVHYMMLGPEDRRTRFFEFLNGINRGTPASAVFQKVFQTDLPSFQKTFEAYIQQRLTWPAMEIHSPGTLDRNRNLVSRTLTEAESESYLGELLIHDDRFNDAESHIRAAIKLNPGLAAAQAAMGRLLIGQKKSADAIPYLERAVQLDPSNHLAHYYYASALQERRRAPSDADWETARAELLKAIDLAPQFTAATELFANMNLIRNTDMPRTVEYLRKARTYAPGDDNLIVMLAFALARTGQRDEARALAEAVLLKTTLTPVMRRNAETVLASLDETRVSRASIGSAPQGSEGSAVDSSRIRGVLTMIECANGATLLLSVDGTTMRFHSRTPNDIRFSTTMPLLSPTIGCGALPGGGVPAVIVYRAEDPNGSDGEPLAVDIGEEQ